MIEIGIAVCIAGLIAVPHVLPLHVVPPPRASAIWILALALRALVAMGAVIFAFVYLPQTALFEALMRLCWHAVLPLVSTHLGLSGHPFADAALLLPGLALTASVIWVLFGITRAWLALKVQLTRRTLGDGPLGSTVIEDDEVLIGVARVGRARVMVSKAALRVLDPEELAAGLAHEVGHIRRRHRPLLLVATVLAALGKPLPGTATAERELVFSIERDADEYALRETHDPLALASAICKAAGARCPAAVGGLRGGGVTLRLEYLLHGAVRGGGVLLDRFSRALVIAMMSMVLLIVITLPAWAVAAPGPVEAVGHSEAVCES
jgi:hypothetical protein